MLREAASWGDQEGARRTLVRLMAPSAMRMPTRVDVMLFAMEKLAVGVVKAHSWALSYFSATILPCPPPHNDPLYEPRQREPI